VLLLQNQLPLKNKGFMKATHPDNGRSLILTLHYTWTYRLIKIHLLVVTRHLIRSHKRLFWLLGFLQHWAYAVCDVLLSTNKAPICDKSI